MAPYNLLVAQPNFEITHVISEKNIDAPSTLTITGPYLMQERRNRNGRIYEANEMASEVDRYNREFIATKRSLGELNHPPSAEVNPERACHMVTSLVQEGNYYIGKSKILSTPLGQVVRNLIMDGCQLGVSSRGLGQIAKGSDGDRVSGFKLVCVDVVTDPSVDKAFVNGILESKQWILNETNGAFEEAFGKLESNLVHLPKHDTREFLRTLALEFIKQL